jgi:glycosyltransferase involved in cell wall biosynthesis
MNVLQLSTNDAMGGAARAAKRLNDALNQLGVISRMFVVNRTGNGTEPLRFHPFRYLPDRLGWQLYRVARRLQNPVRCTDGTLFSRDWTFYRAQPLRQLPHADIFNLHWVVDLLDYRAMLGPMAQIAPLVWTLHDMNAFTGGCHYTAGCERFTEECHTCPKLGSTHRRDRSYIAFHRKQKALAEVPGDRLKIVCPSGWMEGEAKRSALFRRYDTVVIPNGIDTEEFQPMEKQAARRELGLGAEEKVVLFVADFLTDTRKGFRFLLGALDVLRDLPGLRVLTLGHIGLLGMDAPMYRHLGHVNSSKRLATAYAAADVFVIPSLQDNLPNTILEAMACGRPVVGFDTGGIADAVRQGETGLLATVGDSADLAKQISWVLEHPASANTMGQAARERTLTVFSLRKQGEAYRAVYEEMLEKAEPRLGKPFVH